MPEYRNTRYERRNPRTMRTAYLRAARGFRILALTFRVRDYQSGYFLDDLDARTFDLGSAHHCAIAQAFRSEWQNASDEAERAAKYVKWPSPWDYGADQIQDNGVFSDPPDRDRRSWYAFHQNEDEWTACGFMSMVLTGDNETDHDYHRLNWAWRTLITYKQSQQRREWSA